MKTEEKEKRLDRIEFKVTEGEKKWIQEYANIYCSGNVSVYCRMVTLGKLQLKLEGEHKSNPPANKGYRIKH